MNFIQRMTLSAIGGLDLSTKKVGNQVSLTPNGRAGTPILQPYALQAAIERDMKRNPFLYSALTKKADAIANVPFYVEEFVGGKWRRIVNHEAEHLIEGANPFMSGHELKKLLVYHKELSGSAYMQIVTVNGKPRFLQPLFPQYVRVVPGRNEFIERFEYRIDGENDRDFGAKSVFWTKHPDPGDPYRGLSPLEAIAGELQGDYAAREWQKVSMSQRGASDVAFVMRDVVTEEDYALVKRMIEDRYTGPNNARRPWILGGNSEVRPMSHNAVEMDYINTRKFNREVISAALGVPAPLIGDADNSTYNNLDTLKQEFWQGTLTNYLEELRQDMTRQILLPYYGDGRRTKTPALRYMYDLSNVEALQKNVKEKADIALTMSQAGFSIEAINEYLEFDFPPEMLTQPEPEPQESERGLPPDAEERAAFVLDQILTRGVSKETFATAVKSMHTELAKALGKEADEEYVDYRIKGYLNDLDSSEDRTVIARNIARQEVRVLS